MDSSLIVPILVLGLGCLLAFGVVGRRQATIPLGVAGSLALGPGIAAGCLSLGSFFSVVAGMGQPGLGSFLAIAVVFGTAIFLAAGHRRSSISHADPLPRWDVAVGWVVSAALAVGYFWSFTRSLDNRPLGSYDAMGIWTYRALQWFRSGESFPEIIGLLVESQPGYPLLLPGLIVSQFNLWGGESIAIVVATGWFFVIGLAAVTYFAVARWARPGAALAAMALLLSTPNVWRSAFAQIADLPLAYLTLTAAVGLTDLVVGGEHRSVPAWLTGFFLGLMVWTKNEGMVFSLILVAVFAFWAWISRGRLDLRGWVAVAFGSVPGVLATVIYKYAWVTTGEIDRYLGWELFSRLADPQRWYDVAAAFAAQLLPGSNGALWGGTWLVLAGLLVVSAIRQRPGTVGRIAAMYGIAFGLFFVFDFAVYLITPEPLQWHLQTSLDRLLLQILPIGVVAASIWCAGDAKSQGETLIV